MTFDRFAQGVSQQVVRPWFFIVVVAAIVVWLPTLVLWDTGPSDLLVDSLTNPLSLILLVLLQNSQSRQEKAQDQRQDQLEKSLALMLRQAAAHEDDAEERRVLCDAADALVHNAEMSTAMATGEPFDADK